MVLAASAGSPRADVASFSQELSDDRESVVQLSLVTAGAEGATSLAAGEQRATKLLTISFFPLARAACSRSATSTQLFLFFCGRYEATAIRDCDT